jgi:DNA-binding response OmpR family regulator
MAATKRPMPRLLLVEDDPATHSALRALLTRRGWDVLVATSVNDGQVLLESQPAVVVLDLMLPDGDGGVILEEIRRRGLPIGVAVQTGVNDLEWLKRIEGMKPELMLKKPIDLGELMRFLEKRKNGGKE